MSAPQVPSTRTHQPQLCSNSSSSAPPAFQTADDQHTATLLSAIAVAVVSAPRPHRASTTNLDTCTPSSLLLLLRYPSAGRTLRSCPLSSQLPALRLRPLTRRRTQLGPPIAAPTVASRPPRTSTQLLLRSARPLVLIPPELSETVDPLGQTRLRSRARFATSLSSPSIAKLALSSRPICLEYWQAVRLGMNLASTVKGR